MKIEVQLFATLAQYQPAVDASGRSVIDVPGGATVVDVLRALAVPDGLPKIILVNGHEADDSAHLAPNDVVTVFPPLAGGR